jgi:hypothetical protein
MADAETNMTRTYASVLVLEAVIIALLWVIGRLYS